MNRPSVVLLAFAAACATSSQAVTPASTTVTASSSTVITPVLNPVGTYSFQTDINGQAVKGTISIRSENNQHVGLISAEGQGDFPITEVKVDGMTLTMSFDTPNGIGTAKLAFAGADFTGGWELGGQSGPMTGKRTS